ncbi:MAG TPA: NifU family protein, partial [Bacteroidetes bacterium]|nr:NifU family protein [Bacteroidota bacterium]
MSELPTLEMINSALDKLRPYLERDGGDVEVVRVTEEGTVE